jgi:hypothetical protein
MFRFAVRSVQCSAADVRFILTCDKEGAGNVSLYFADTRHMRQQSFSLQVEVLLLKLKTLPPDPSGPGQRSRYSDSLRPGRSGDRIPVGARFSTPVQTGPGAHPASRTMGTGSFLAEKRPGRGVDHPPLSSAEVERRVELYICSPSGPSWCVLG